MTRIAALLSLLALPAAAHDATVEAVELRLSGATWTVSVTIRHAETGWDDYADGWRVEAPDGTILGNRELLHPHANEQPFTRSLSGVVIPADLQEIQIRTRTNTTGWSDETTAQTVP
jgi:hypothetical protein